MKVSLIAAVAQNRVIGINNTLPWQLPEDLAFFKQYTMGKPVIMGRKTYESIRRPLPGRLNIVISRDVQWQPPALKDGKSPSLHPLKGLHFPIEGTLLAKAASLQEALDTLALVDEAVIIGGSQLYTQALDSQLVDKLVLTEIQHPFEGDAYFPNWDRGAFAETSRQSNPAHGERPWAYNFVTYERTNSNKE